MERTTGGLLRALTAVIYDYDFRLERSPLEAMRVSNWVGVLGSMSTGTQAISMDDVAGLVHQILEERSIHAVVSPDSDLRDLGLTSLDMVALVLSVEAEFDLTIPESQITPANFRSVSTINALVGSLRS